MVSIFSFIVWDGRITKGLCVREVSFACPNDKRKNGDQKCTGLWSIGRDGYPHVIEAPKYFTDALPDLVPLCGELWTKDDNNFTVASIVARKNLSRNDIYEWEKVRFIPFNIKPYKLWFNNDEVTKRSSAIIFNEHKMNPHDPLDIAFSSIWFHDLRYYVDVLDYLYKLNEQAGNEVLKTAWFSSLKINKWDQLKKHAIENNWEGYVFVNLNSQYEIGVTHNILKWKRDFDVEAKIVAYTAGNEDKKYAGKIGALIVETVWEENAQTMIGGESTNPGMKVRYEVSSGLTDEDRDGSPRVAIGKTITVKFNSITKYGIPHTGRIDAFHG